MFVYYVTILFLLMAGFTYTKLDKNVKLLFDALVLILFVLVFGSRFEVGADWFNYVNIYERYESDLNIFNRVEFGYKALNVIGSVSGLGYQFVIFSSSFLFFVCTHLAIKRLGLNPYFYLAIVGPYHLVMSGMNYTRQSIALSIFVLSLSFLITNNRARNIVAMVFCVSFHKSSILMFAMSFSNIKKRYLAPLGGVLAVGFAYTVFDEYSARYLESARYDSKGFYLRYVFLLACTVFIYLANQHTFQSKILNRIKKVQYSFTIFIFILSFASTTAADRLAYFLIMSGTLLVMLAAKRTNWRQRLSIQSLSLAVLFFISFSVFIVWATLGNIAQYYQYKSMIFVF